jgi:hypothetical protein
MHLAEKLGYTLMELTSRITEEELQLWLAYFQLEEDENKKASRRR